MGTTPETLAKATKGLVVAGAGCGKTELIARSAGLVAPPRQLVLTHTHAGVHALRARLSRIGARTANCEVGTLDGFALRHVAAYPRLGGVHPLETGGGFDWGRVGAGAVHFLEHRVAGEILRASYRGVFVDEYQDCSIDQHRLVESISRYLPVRVLGDPLQAVFSFEEIVDWGTVESSFDRLQDLEVPYRWRDTNPALGEWLGGVRVALGASATALKIDTRVRGVTWRVAEPLEQLGECKRALSAAGSVLALHGGLFHGRGVDLGAKLQGAYQCIEPIDSKDLRDLSRAITRSIGSARAVAVLGVIERCYVRARTELATVRSAIRAGGGTAGRRMSGGRGGLLDALNAVAAADNLAPVLRVFAVAEEMLARRLFRRDIWSTLRSALQTCIEEESENLEGAVQRVRELQRWSGRAIPRRCLGTTLLAKGLEFDHCLVLDADSLSREELYVALTRGAASLVVLSKDPTIRVRQPEPKKQMDLFRK